jgi:hypothetical protein
LGTVYSHWQLVVMARCRDAPLRNKNCQVREKPRDSNVFLLRDPNLREED